MMEYWIEYCEVMTVRPGLSSMSSASVLQVAVFAHFMTAGTANGVKEKHRVIKRGKIDMKKGTKDWLGMLYKSGENEIGQK